MDLPIPSNTAPGGARLNPGAESRSSMDDTHDSQSEQPDPGMHSVNQGYVLRQLAHAFATSQHHKDPATRERATATVTRWLQVFQGMLSGSLTIGSRTPVAETPVWATLEVVSRSETSSGVPGCTSSRTRPMPGGR